MRKRIKKGVEIKRGILGKVSGTVNGIMITKNNIIKIKK